MNLAFVVREGREGVGMGMKSAQLLKFEHLTSSHAAEQQKYQI